MIRETRHTRICICSAKKFWIIQVTIVEIIQVATACGGDLNAYKITLT